MKIELMLALLLSLALFAVAEDDEERIPFIGVSAEETVQEFPDYVELELAIEIVDADISKAKSEADEVIRSVLTYFKTIQIEPDDVTASQIRIHPRFEWKDDNREFTGYTVRRNININIRDMEKVNDIINRVLKLGVNRVDDIHLRSSREEEIMALARVKAFKKARTQASRIAGEVGVRLGRALEIRLRDPNEGAFIAMGGPSDTPAFKPGKIEIKSEVYVEFELLY